MGWQTKIKILFSDKNLLFPPVTSTSVIDLGNIPSPKFTSVAGIIILFIFKKVTDTTYLKDDNGLHTLV